MDAQRRQQSKSKVAPTMALERSPSLKGNNKNYDGVQYMDNKVPSKGGATMNDLKALALEEGELLPFPRPNNLTNSIFFTLFFSAVYFLLQSWREKIRNSTPLHVVNFTEIDNE